MQCTSAVQREHIAGNVARFTYDSIVDRDLIVVAEDLESLPEAPKHSRKSQEERAADMIPKMGNLLGKSEPTSPGSLLAAHVQPDAGSCRQKQGGLTLLQTLMSFCAFMLACQGPLDSQLHLAACVCSPHFLACVGHSEGSSSWISGPIGTCMTSAAGQLTRLFAMQGLRIDESTAMYYLKESGGDLKKAVKLFGVLPFLA